MQAKEVHALQPPILRGSTAKGDQPSGSRDYHFISDAPVCILGVGREMRDDWSEQETEGGPAAFRTFARLAVAFLPDRDGGPITDKQRFSAAFKKVLRQRQVELQQLGHPPALALTLAHVRWPHLQVGHVGDSRCYVVRNRKLIRITKDQTRSPQPPDRPLVSDPAISRHLSSVVGGFSDDLAIQVSQRTLEPSDTVLLCTSGITQVLSDTVLATLVAPESSQPERPLEEVAQAILNASGAIQSGSDRTVALARFCATTGHR